MKKTILTTLLSILLSAQLFADCSVLNFGAPITTQKVKLFSSDEKENIKVYNITGQLVINIAKAENISSIDVTNLKTGNYFIVIQTYKGIYKSKFIKN